jgi:protein-S-isoprenylcysteine O-methyltransferase Ste14
MNLTTPRIIETGIAIGLFLGYVILWRTKRVRELRRTGVDPEVLTRASTPVQAYFARLVRVMTLFVVAIIALHTFAPDTWRPLARVDLLDSSAFDLLGGIVGLAGLGLAALAQKTMGSSWRVGIDTTNNTDLISGGVYRWIRNPTYVGLHLVSVGLWVIWPTTLVLFYGVLFFLVMDIQVRCEEEFLIAVHGERYRKYAARTWRYLPRVY